MNFFFLHSLVLYLFFSVDGYPHGENIPGPHGGYIRMPGGFHTELLIENNTLAVYLLDVEFNNPVVKRSNVSGVYKGKNKQINFECTVKHDYFRCELPNDLNLETGEINLKTNRLGMPAGIALYKLPLTRSAPGKPTIGSPNQNTTAPSQCIVCGMDVKPESKAAFDSTKEGKPVRFCSFSCAHGFHKKYPKEKLVTKDYDSGKTIDTSSAYFLVGSDNILKELEFVMPPAIVAFETEESAKKMQARLKDGELIKGFNSLEKKYQ